MGSIRSSRGEVEEKLDFDREVRRLFFLVLRHLDDAEKLKIQLVRGVKFHGFFVVIPNHSYGIDRDGSFERVSKTHSYASSIPEFLRTHALNIRSVLRLVTHYV